MLVCVRLRRRNGTFFVCVLGMECVCALAAVRVVHKKFVGEKGKGKRDVCA